MLRSRAVRIAFAIAFVLGPSANVTATTASLTDVTALYERGSGKAGPGNARRTERLHDAIVGTGVLANLELCVDYDDGVGYTKPY